MIKKPWDIALTERMLSKVVDRRSSPDGLERIVKVHKTTFKRIYPWGEMNDGDFFVVGKEGYSQRAMLTGFRHSAARHGFEISIQEWDGGESFRVTRVMGCIEVVKLVARAMGADIEIHDTSHRKKRQREAKKGNFIYNGGFMEKSETRPDLPPVVVDPAEAAAGRVNLPAMGNREKLIKRQREAARSLGLKDWEPND